MMGFVRDCGFGGGGGIWRRKAGKGSTGRWFDVQRCRQDAKPLFVQFWPILQPQTVSATLATVTLTWPLPSDTSRKQKILIIPTYVTITSNKWAKDALIAFNSSSTSFSKRLSEDGPVTWRPS